MSVASSFLVACLLCAPIPAPQDDGAQADRLPSTPVESVRAAAAAIHAQDLGALWRLLPASYQDDATRLVHRFARSVSPEVHAKSFALLDEFAALLRSKRELLLQCDLLRRDTRDDAVLGARLDTLSEVVRTLAHSPLARRDEFESLDVGAFLEGGGNTIARGLATLVAGPDGSDPAGVLRVGELLVAAEFEVVDATTRRARVRVRVDPSGELDSDPLTLVEVEGRWIPEDLALAWNKNVSEFERRLASHDPIAQRVVALQVLAEVEGLFDRVEQMTRAEELQQAGGGAFLAGMEVAIGGAAPIFRRMAEAEVAGTRVKMQNLRGAILSYRRHHKTVPMALEDLAVPAAKNFGEPYVDALSDLHDAWDNPFRYARYDSNNYALTSYGADGSPGGEGPDADITLP